MAQERPIDNIVRAYLNELQKQGIRVERAYLFGSQARGDAHPDSDIDLLVISLDFEEMPVTAQWRAFGKAALALMQPVEPLAFSPREVEECMEREGNFIRHILTQPETIEYRI